MRLEKLNELFKASFIELTDFLRSFFIDQCSRMGYLIDGLDLEFNSSEILPGVRVKVCQSKNYNNEVIKCLEDKIESKINNVIYEYILEQGLRIKYSEDGAFLKYPRYIELNFDQLKKACIN
jgi:hypothetical protein